jgi:hypothetical protein
MHSPIVALIFTIIPLIAVVMVINRLVRRGISRKYERPTKSVKPENKWNALNAGEDPTL